MIGTHSNQGRQQTNTIDRDWSGVAVLGMEVAVEKEGVVLGVIVVWGMDMEAEEAVVVLGVMLVVEVWCLVANFLACFLWDLRKQKLLRRAGWVHWLPFLVTAWHSLEGPLLWQGIRVFVFLAYWGLDLTRGLVMVIFSGTLEKITYTICQKKATFRKLPFKVVL